MPTPICTEEEFIRLYQTMGGAETARTLGVGIRSVQARRARIEQTSGRVLKNPNMPSPSSSRIYDKRLPYAVSDGVVIIGSDAHYWPDEITPAHRAFCKLAKDLKPKLVILNGDVLDGARISRHARIQWQRTPTLKEELETVEARITEIEDAARGSERLWLLGNHDMRFESRLSEKSQEYEEINGFALVDHFPKWKMGISAWINQEVVVKHRFKGGIHATHNNTLWSGKSIVTGHLHSLKVTPFDDYNGTRWGIDTGTLSNPYGDHAAYTEDNPLNHRSGFVVLTFHEGQLLWPEIVLVIDEDHVQFRGAVIEV